MLHNIKWVSGGWGWGGRYICVCLRNDECLAACVQTLQFTQRCPDTSSQTTIIVEPRRDLSVSIKLLLQVGLAAVRGGASALAHH